MNKPLAFLYCKACGNSGLDLFVTKESLGAICPECHQFVFDIVDLKKFIASSLFRANIPLEAERLVN